MFLACKIRVFSSGFVVMIPNKFVKADEISYDDISGKNPLKNSKNFTKNIGKNNSSEDRDE